jgi:short-subunit dehydrogenase
MTDLSVRALTLPTSAVAPAFVARGGGTIINISSAVGIGPEILNRVYGGPKAFVLAFRLSLHKELAERRCESRRSCPARPRRFWDAAGDAVEKLPSAMVMRADDLVDFDHGDLVTIPFTSDAADWDAYGRRGRSLSRTCRSAFRLRATASPPRRRSGAGASTRWSRPRKL